MAYSCVRTNPLNIIGFARRFASRARSGSLKMMLPNRHTGAGQGPASFIPRRLIRRFGNGMNTPYPAVDVI